MKAAQILEEALRWLPEEETDSIVYHDMLQGAVDADYDTERQQEIILRAFFLSPKVCRELIGRKLVKQYPFEGGEIGDESTPAIEAWKKFLSQNYLQENIEALAQAFAQAMKESEGK